MKRRKHYNVSPALIAMITMTLVTLASGKIIYVDDDAARANDGTSWENAYVYLQDALADAETTDKPVEIRVAQGVYKPDQGANQTPGDREATFQLINGVTLKGSYVGIGNADPNERKFSLPVKWNLAGEWFLGGSDIQGSHTWDGFITINSSGVVTGGTLLSSEGREYSFTGGDLAIDATGRVNGSLKDSDGVTTKLTLQMNYSNSIMAGEGNAEIDDEDGVFIFIKKSSGFTAENLAGEWFLGGSDIQDNHTWDGLVVIDSRGTVTGDTLRSSEGPEYQFIGGEFSIDPTGRVAGTVTDSDGITTRLTMQMDVAGSIMAGEGNSIDSQEDGVFVLIKKTYGFTTENLAGEWFLGGSDIQGNHTWDGLVIINSKGTVIGGTLISSEGPVYELTGGGLAIDDNGEVTGTLMDSDGVTTEFTMQMSKSKYLMAGKANARADDEDGVFVFVRRSSGYETILSGDLLGNDGSDFANNNENSYHVVTGSSTDKTALLDGFTIIGGNANGPRLGDESPYDYRLAHGGGMYNYGGSPTLTNCTFSGNLAPIWMSLDLAGGGMCNTGNSNPTLTNCTFSGNLSGGMVNQESSPTLTNCTFSGNLGPGVSCRASSPVLTNCTFTGNSAPGGGVRCDDSSSPVLTNCTITRNPGGGVNCWGSSPVLTNCMITGNSADDGAGVSCYNFSSPVLINCTITGNLARERWGGGFDCSNSSPMLTSCIVWGNVGGSIDLSGSSNPQISFSCIEGGFLGEGNIDENPLFADPGYWVNVNDPNIVVDPNDPNAVCIDGDYHLKSEAGRWNPSTQTWVTDDVTSPCIDAGDPNMPVRDEPFPSGLLINMGAYGGTVEASKSISDVTEVVNVNGNYNGSQVTLRQGQILAVTLESNPTTGYSWDRVEKQDSIFEKFGDTLYFPSEQGDGAGGWEILYFRSMNIGQETLELVYRRSWETDVEPAKTFSIDVVVN